MQSASVFIGGVKINTATKTGWDASFIWPQQADGIRLLQLASKSSTGADLFSNSVGVKYVQTPQSSQQGGPFSRMPMYKQTKLTAAAAVAAGTSFKNVRPWHRFLSVHDISDTNTSAYWIL